MPKGYSLIKEATTKFGTTVDLVHRFLKPASRLKHLMSTINGDKVNKSHKLFALLKSEISTDDSISHLTLEAIVHCFSALRHAEMVLEDSSEPKMNHVLPVLEEFKNII